MNCTEWLDDYMGEPMMLYPVDAVKVAAADAGFKKRELKTARVKLRVGALNHREDGQESKYFWYRL